MTVDSKMGLRFIVQWLLPLRWYLKANPRLPCDRRAKWEQRWFSCKKISAYFLAMTESQFIPEHCVLWRFS